MERKDLTRWLDTHYFAHNMALVAIGGSFSEATHFSDEYFSGVKSQSDIPRQVKPLPDFKGPHFELIDNSDNEYDVQISFVCGGTNDPRTPAYDMISRILGDGFSSRLVKRIREELGIVYDLACGFYQYEGGGTFNINVNLSEPNIETFFTEFSKIIKTLTLTGASPNEISRHRERANIDLALITSDPTHLAFRLGWAALTRGNTSLESWSKQLDLVDSRVIAETSKQLFDPQNLSVVALGPKSPEVTKKFSEVLRM